jgi:ketosteroid isomerase-like protein
MDTRAVAAEFTRLCKEGKADEAGQRFWSDKVVSIEAMDGPMARCSGLKEVEAKGEWWYTNNEVHSFETEGPFVNGDQFALQFKIDVTPKTGEMAGKRMQMTEVGLYTVKDGKVVEERFFY